ncbi:hypothetical protein LIER_35924 [Lithospermum erythrorhizon]|uniref:Myb-like domain-containing protein n=1 Tax=Lithospermum erythrorhizon TaxID=34254 RepID=A0AAV3P108_LITER
MSSGTSQGNSRNTSAPASVGAEITYGNSNFSQTHDPFDNVILPQEVVQAVAGRADEETLEEIGGSAGISTSRTTSPEPFSVVHSPLATNRSLSNPQSASTLASISQYATSSHTGEALKTLGWTAKKWNYVDGGMGEEETKVWTTLAEACRPKFPKNAAVKAHIAMLQRICTHNIEYKCFARKGVNPSWPDPLQRV